MFNAPASPAEKPTAALRIDTSGCLASIGIRYKRAATPGYLDSNTSATSSFASHPPSAMTSAKALWDSLLPDIKQAVTGLAAAWLSRRARRIESGLPARSPEVSDDDSMETGSDDDSAAAPAPSVHVGLRMKQTQAHYNAVMAEVPVPLTGYQRALKQHRLTKGQLNCKRASEEAVAALAMTNPNFIAEQRAIY